MSQTTDHDIEAIIKELKHRDSTDGRDFNEERIRREEEHQAGIAAFWKEMKGIITPASPAYYRRWLRAYIEDGGKPTNYYDYNDTNTYYVATSDFTIYPLYGSSGVNIIVPPGVKYLGGNPGHNSIFTIDGPGVVGSRVPVYKDSV